MPVGIKSEKGFSFSHFHIFNVYLNQIHISDLSDWSQPQSAKHFMHHVIDDYS